MPLERQLDTAAVDGAVMPTSRRERGPRLAYGDREVGDFLASRILQEGRLLPLLTPTGVSPIPDVRGALIHSVEASSTQDLAPPLKDWLRTRYRGGDVAVIVDDYTRPCVHQRLLLPPLLEWLLAEGGARDRIVIVLATATHRDPRPEQFPHRLGHTLWPAWRDSHVPH